MPSDEIARTSGGNSATLLRALAVWGPGVLVMLADTDAGNVVTAAQAGAQWGYRLLRSYFSSSRCSTSSRS